MKNEKLTETLRVQFTAEQARRIREQAELESRAVSAMVRVLAVRALNGQ